MNNNSDLKEILAKEVFPKLRSMVAFASLLMAILAVFFAVKVVEELKLLPSVGAGVAPQTTISVSGEGKETGVPDTAQFSFTVQNEALQVAQAQSATTKTVNAALDFLKKQGVPDKNITTVSYNIYPRYEYHDVSTGVVCPTYGCPNGKQVLAGYNVSQTVSVKAEEIGKTGTLLGGLGEIGVTNVSGLSFTFKDPQTLQDGARAKAIADAKAKAHKIADQLGVHLVRITNFSEGNQGVIYPMAMESAAVGKGGGTPTVPTGESTITSNVTITYEIN